MKKIALLQGGLSSEKEISLKTGEAFARALASLNYEFETIDVQEDLPVALYNMKPDVALLALHGKWAEDGTVQGICEYMKIPYTGSGVLGSALAMNKVKSKEVLAHNNLPTPEWQVLNRNEVVDFQITAESIRLDEVVVVKPARDGSSLGLSICKKRRDLAKAIELAFKYDELILIEDYIPGKEITVPMLAGKTLCSIEIVPKEGYYDYKNKYTVGKTDYLLPASLSPQLLQKLNEITLKACDALDVRGYARVDFRVDEMGRPFVLEVNTLPGCTETSLVPKAAAHDGIEFTSFIDQLIRSARLDYEDVF